MLARGSTLAGEFILSSFKMFNLEMRDLDYKLLTSIFTKQRVLLTECKLFTCIFITRQQKTAAHIIKSVLSGTILAIKRKTRKEKKRIIKRVPMPVLHFICQG